MSDCLKEELGVRTPRQGDAFLLEKRKVNLQAVSSMLLIEIQN